MNDGIYEQNLRGGMSFRSITQYPQSDFWTGYVRGLRRLHHGERFGTDEEHKIWFNLSDTEIDEGRRYRGIGYRTGFSGTSIADAIEYTKTEFGDPETV